MAYTLPPLPYAPDALEPHIDKQTMEIHHGKHHQTLHHQPERRAGEASRAADEERRGPDPRHQHGSRGHSHGRPQQRRWPCQPQHVLADHGPPRRRSADRRHRRRHHVVVRRRSTRSRSSSQKPASAASAAAGRGSSINGGKLVIESTANQDSPLMEGKKPVFGDRRLGARVLPEVSEPTPRLHQRLVERGELERGQQTTPLTL